MNDLGVYIHFPWCVAKCPYCDFASFARGADAIDHDGYADAVIAEIAHRAPVLSAHRITTVFFGGGTPSLWEPRALGRVRAALEAAAGAWPAPEVTAEANPTSLTPERARSLFGEGINRFSVGVQGLDEARLRFLGRWHDPEEALRAVEGALATGARVSADLIFGVAGDEPEAAQTPAQAAEEAGRVADLGLAHISAYALTIEPQTDFGARARRGRLPLLDDDRIARCFEEVGVALEARGLLRYEVSNFARPGEESRHNLGYWRGQPYLGLGAAAFGTLESPEGAVRYRNSPNPERYLHRIGRGDFSPHEREVLAPETRLRERLMLGLRLREGFDLEGAARDLGVEPWPSGRRAAAERLVEAGRLRLEGGRLFLPEEAWLYADGVAVELF